MSKKVILIWDFDGAIGQINSTYPYNYVFDLLESEINNVESILSLLDEYNVKSCFAITGFSAEKGVFPYVFPELINEICKKGHEVASHSWRHEWIPIFRKEQIKRSLKRSKSALEKAISNKQEVIGFVPPHNRPMSWLKKGAFSIGDRGFFPFFPMADNESLIKLLKQQKYKWIRISYKSIWHRLKLKKRKITGRVYSYKNILILENHYTGFDEKIVHHIFNSKEETYTISAHPAMFSYENKHENKNNFIQFLKMLTESDQNIEFVTPSQLIEK